jgi:hypothetical protein
MENTETPKLRTKDLISPSKDLHQSDTLRAVKLFLRDLVKTGEVTMDPERLYHGVCKALGEAPEKLST